MDQFAESPELFSFQLKQQAGFGKGGERNFDGVVTELQMQSYLVTRDFRRRLNKKGATYGWAIAVYSTPEALWGYDHVTSAYYLDPAASRAKIRAQVKKHFSGAQDLGLDVVLG